MIEFFYNNNVHIAMLITSFFVITEKHSRMKFSVKKSFKEIRVNHKLYNENEKIA